MKLLKLTAALLISFSAAAIGSIFTIANIPTWYVGLNKPPLLPPNELFGPVWTILYALIGVSLYLVWTAKSKAPKQQAYTWFGLQLALNTLWSLVFFGLHQPWLGVIVIVLLNWSILVTVIKFRAHSRLAAGLFLPYLAWVLFATYLTIGVAALN